jgi:LysM repeat protein
LFVSGQFQPAEVTKSTEKVLIQGCYYFIHTVRKGQTFYSICKAYGVSQEIVLQNNPGINPDALSEGQALRIPDIAQEVVTDSREEKPKEDKRFYYHTVKPGQTVYFLSRKYDVPEAWIYQFNPEAREKISAGQVIIIPKKKSFESILASADTSEFWYYTVKEMDTLYSLSKQFGVSVATIINENPQLQDGLKAGTVIKIRKQAALEADTLTSDSTKLIIPETICYEEPVKKRELKVALLLPFFSDLSFEEPMESSESDNYEISENPVKMQQLSIGRSFFEFYEGFLLALDSLKKTGSLVKLYVYDTKRDTLKTLKIISELYSIQPDLIIGPVFSDEVKLVGQFARNQGINLISPLSTRSELIMENPNIVQVVPPEETEYKLFAQYLSKYKNNPVILFRDDDSVSLKQTWKLKKELLAYFENDSLWNPLNLRDYKINDSTIRKLGKILKHDADNIIIIASDKEPDVSELIGKLFLFSRVYKLTIFGMPAWQVWKRVDINYFHIMQMQYYTPFYIDYNNKLVRDFIRKCRNMYGFEPYEVTTKGYNFSMLGYDIGFYFISALEKYGRNFTPCLNSTGISSLLTPFCFVKTGEGYSNQTIRIIKYNSDFTVEIAEDLKPDTTVKESE